MLLLTQSQWAKNEKNCAINNSQNKCNSFSRDFLYSFYVILTQKLNQNKTFSKIYISEFRKKENDFIPA